jgi:hypothetical protein
METRDYYIKSTINEKHQIKFRYLLDEVGTKVGKVYVNNNRSVCDADLTIELLAGIALAGSDNVRITKELLTGLFDSDWVNTIAYALVLERDAANAAMLLSDTVSGEDKAAFWNGEHGQKFMAIAKNYKQYIVSASEKVPSFISQAIKDKVLTAIGYLDQESQAVQKVSDKLNKAPVASVDASGL